MFASILVDLCKNLNVFLIFMIRVINDYVSQCKLLVIWLHYGYDMSTA